MKLIFSIPLLLLATPLVSAVRRPLLGRSNGRILQPDDASCTEENQLLATTGSLGDMDNDDPDAEDGVLFFWLSLSRNYSSYIDCDETASPSVCDYTKLRDKMKPLCEYYGGTLYSVTGQGECGAEEGPFDEINLPICIGPSCDVKPKVDSIANVDGCSAVSDYVPAQAEFVLDEACRAEQSVLLKSGSMRVDGGVGIGSGDYAYSEGYSDRYDEFCPGDVCDFSGLAEELKSECEALGGSLYVFDDSWTSVKTYTEEEVVENTYETTSIPICVGTSCPVDIFFTQVVFPALQYGLGGTYLADAEDRNATRVDEYTPGNYRAISSAADPTASPGEPSGSCVAENQLLATTGSLGDMNNDDPDADDGVLFFWLSQSRNYSSYIDCDETASPSVCDYTKLRDKMKPLCEYYGGTLYSVSGQGECGAEEGPFDEIDLPICVGPSCDVNPKVDSIANVDGCSAVSDYVPAQAEYVLDEACRAEQSVLLKSGSMRVDGGVGIGSGDYAYSEGYSDRYDEFCPGDVCDFSGLAEELKSECEALGGSLYVFDDSWTQVKTYAEEEVVENTYETTSIPICVGTSCPVDIFFTQVVFPALQYGLGGTYLPDSEDRNATRVDEYTPGNYRAISSAADPTSSPGEPSGSCVAENEFLAKTGYLGNMNNDDPDADDGVLFFWLSQSRNYSSYIDCDLTVSPSVCDYTKLRDAMKPFCELSGGTLYSVTGQGECGAEDGPFDEINLPICIGPSCDVKPKADSIANVEGCSAVSEYVSEQAEFVLDSACRAELSMLLKSGSGIVDGSIGIGSSAYVYEGTYASRFDEFCPGDSSQCDFGNALDELKAECEGFGGYLYVYDDTWVSVKTYPDTGEVETTTTTSTNVPICVGASCPVDVFFNQIVFPADQYSMSGSFLPDSTDNNATRVDEYTSSGNYTAISNVPVPATPSPNPPAATTAPNPPTATAAPNAAPTAGPTDTSAASGLPPVTQFALSALFTIAFFLP